MLSRVALIHLTRGFRNIDELHEFLASLEMRNLFRWHHHLNTGRGIPSNAAAPLMYAKDPQTADLNAVATVERSHHGREYLFKDQLSIAQGDA